MLPFLKHKQDGSMSAPVEKMERKPDEEAEYDPMESAAEDLMHAVHSKDIKGIAAALRASHDLHNSQFDEEYQ